MESLAHELETLITNASLRETLGRAARERATTYLSLERCADEYFQLYERVSINS